MPKHDNGHTPKEAAAAKTHCFILRGKISKLKALCFNVEM